MSRGKAIAKNVVMHYVLLNILGSFLGSVLMLGGIEYYVPVGVMVLVTGIWYFLHRKKIEDMTIYVNAAILCIQVVVFTVMMIIAGGSVAGPVMANFGWVIFPYFPAILFFALMGKWGELFLTTMLLQVFGTLLAVFIRKRRDLWKKGIVLLTVCAILAGINTYLYVNRPEKRYSGHGFAYMHGYSSTDFQDYTVYAKNSKLVTLEEAPQFTIERVEEMPVLDGAEACYPLYAAVAKAVYQGIDDVERSYDTTKREKGKYFTNGRIVQFTNTITGFQRLLSGDCDLFFGAMPSQQQRDWAKDLGVELILTPIGKEAFVFFVEKDNSVENLSTEQIKGIYHGDIVNWHEVGGRNQRIEAFQRPNNSGSQTMMEYFMGETQLMEPKTYQVFDSMVGVIKNVAQYANDAGAMGYTFRYFLEGLNQEKGVKILAVDGVTPSVETIRSGEYPIVTNLYLITRKDNSNPNVQKMIEFMLSEQGQELVEKTGYGPLN